MRGTATPLPDYTLGALRAQHRLGAAGAVPVLGLDRRQHRAGARRRDPRGSRARGAAGRRARRHPAPAAAATTRRSASAASRCRAASASAWPSRARCWPTRRCCCSTTRCRPWTPAPERASWRICASTRARPHGDHRQPPPVAVADADEIVVLRDGHVVERGDARAARRARRRLVRRAVARTSSSKPSLDAA